MKPQLSCEGCRGLIRRIPTRFYSVAMADYQPLTPPRNTVKKRLLPVLTFVGDCMEGLVRFVAWLTTWTSGWW